MVIDPSIQVFWNEFSSTLQLVLKGLIIGIVVSAPMGPVGILCVQRTMHKGRRFGLITGLGASLSDLLYAIVTGAGMTVVMSFIEQRNNIFWMKIGGSALLFVFGLHTLLSNPIKAMRQPSGKKGTLVQNLITSFFLTLSNPLILRRVVRATHLHRARKPLRCDVRLPIYLCRRDVVVDSPHVSHHKDEAFVRTPGYVRHQSHDRHHCRRDQRALRRTYALQHPQSSRCTH